MYSTCIHCHAPLGANEAIESCPVGQRLAFDAALGRLWIVCQRCREWNLTPIEERWEAIEECERLFRGTRLRASTDNIGLAKLPEGLELVRVGKPLKPEMAAWRYGAEFRRRRRSALVYGAAFIGPVYAVNILANAQVVPSAVFAVVISLVAGGAAVQIRSRWRPRVVLDDGRVRRLGIRESMHARLEADGDSWLLRWKAGDVAQSLEGAPAQRALRSILAGVNAGGGRSDDIRGALELLDSVGGGDRFLTRIARAWNPDQVKGLHYLSSDIRLAVEMALHEDTERRALEGELTSLENEWRLAEEIAGIADNLFVGKALHVGRLAARDDAGPA